MNPRDRRWASAWVVAAIAYGAIIFWQGSIEFPPAPARWNDKVDHAVAFGAEFVLAWLAAARWPLSRGMRLAVPAGVAIFLGGALEVWQAFLPHRSAELGDFLADIVGVALAAVVIHRRGW